jgi:hypothetical protein
MFKGNHVHGHHDSHHLKLNLTDSVFKGISHNWTHLNFSALVLIVIVIAVVALDVALLHLFWEFIVYVK